MKQSLTHLETRSIRSASTMITEWVLNEFWITLPGRRSSFRLEYAYKIKGSSQQNFAIMVKLLNFSIYRWYLEIRTSYYRNKGTWIVNNGTFYYRIATWSFVWGLDLFLSLIKLSRLLRLRNLVPRENVIIID